MRVVILQPSFLPWKGYFHQVNSADIFVFYDDVQYDKNGWRNRNKIKTCQGTQWITVPILTKGRFGQAIRDVEINNRIKWGKKIWNSISMNYNKSPYFSEYVTFFEETLLSEWSFVCELDIFLIQKISEFLGIKTEFVRSSDLNIVGDRMERIINICKHFSADHYLTGPSAVSYNVNEIFEENNIKLEYQSYIYPEYPQQYGKFVGDVSIIDLLFNCGASSSDFIWRYMINE